MASHDGFFTLRPRRSSLRMLLQPVLQLKLPVVIVLLTLAFGLAFGANCWAAYARLHQLSLSQLPEFHEQLFRDQTGNFLAVSGAIAVGYLAAILVYCVRYAHRLVGPTVAFRRHIEALKNGDYASRVVLRRNDAFGEVAADLNDLAHQLEHDEKPPV